MIKISKKGRGELLEKKGVPEIPRTTEKPLVFYAGFSAGVNAAVDEVNEKLKLKPQFEASYSLRRGLFSHSWVMTWPICKDTSLDSIYRCGFLNAIELVLPEIERRRKSDL